MDFNHALSQFLTVAPWILGPTGLIVYLARPTKELLSDLRRDVELLKKELNEVRDENESIRAQNTSLVLAVGSLANGYEELAGLVRKAYPDAVIPTISELLSRFQSPLQQIIRTNLLGSLERIADGALWNRPESPAPDDTKPNPAN